MNLINLIPDYLFNPSMKREVIDFLKTIHLHGIKKKQALASWKQATGARITKEEYTEVLESGW